LSPPSTIITNRLERIELEGRFALWHIALLALGCGAYALLARQIGAATAAIVVILGIAVVAAAASHHSLFEPIRRLALTAQAVGAGDFGERLGFERRDDLGKLARAMDAMCDRLRAAQHASEAHVDALEQLRHCDRVATLGRMASSVAHELGNPLNVIELRAQLIASGDAATAQQAQQSARVIVEQTKRMTRIIEEILSFTRVQPRNVARIDLVSVVRKAFALCAHSGKKYNTRLQLRAPPTPIEIDGDSDKVLQIMVNLLINGMQAMPEGGPLAVTVRIELRAPDDDPEGAPRSYARVDVTDSGVGIPEQLLSKVFEPFFSTKGAAGGTGLGLSVAQGIAREHEGWISVESQQGTGSTFKVHLPRPATLGNNHAS
jgi:signal transduction histidine kinase